MKGYLIDANAADVRSFSQLPAWEAQVADAVGTVIEFWGFKRNQGRIWALLYLRDYPMCATDLESELHLSKGAVSMVVRELEQWRIVRRVRVRGKRSWHYVAERDFMGMIRHVVEHREFVVVVRVREQLESALERAHLDRSVDEDGLERVRRLVRLATRIERAVDTFIKTSRLDIRGVGRVLEGSLRDTVRNAVDAMVNKGSER